MRARAFSLLSGLILLLVAFGSTSAFGADLVPADRTFYLRGTGCGATEEFWLSTESGPDEYDGCGIIGGLPAAEVFRLLEAPLTKSFTARDGVPAALDASKNVTGTIRAESWFGNSVPGAGQVVVEVALRGTKAQGLPVDIGSDSVDALNTGSGGIQVDFILDVPDALQGVELTELTLDVEIHGANWNSGNLGLEGDSKFTLPVLEPVVPIV